MNQLLNDEKHIILTKREYDKLEERANGAMKSYEQEIKDLKEKIAHIEKEKPYISYDFPYSRYYGHPSVVYVENFNDTKVIDLFEKRIDFLKESFKNEILEMSIFDLFKKKKELKKKPEETPIIESVSYDHTTGQISRKG